MQGLKKHGHKALELVQDIGLFIVAIATIIAIGFEVGAMIEAGKVTIADLLLLFIYLEVVSMVAVYLESGKLPIRIPLYIAIVALARYLILDMKNLDTERMVVVAGTALLLAIAVLVIRYGHTKFPYERSEEE